MWGGNELLLNTAQTHTKLFKSVNRWLSIRFNLISCCIIAIVGFVAVLSPAISASLAGFALAFASTITMDVCLELHSLFSGIKLTIFLDSFRGSTIRRVRAVYGQFS